MAIGLQDNGEPTRRINLMQLRRKKRKRGDKTENGRGRTTSTVATGDANPEVAQQLEAAVTQSTTRATNTATSAALQDAVRDDDECGRCHELAPPSDRASRQKHKSGSLRGLSESYAKRGITPIASA